MDLIQKVGSWVVAVILVFLAGALIARIAVPTAMWSYNYITTDTPGRHFSLAGATPNGGEDTNDGPVLQNADYRQHRETRTQRKRKVDVYHLTDSPPGCNISCNEVVKETLDPPPVSEAECNKWQADNLARVCGLRRE